MLNKNQNNHGHLFVKVSAALAAMAIVSATSVEMYQIFGENKNMTSAQNQTTVTTNDTKAGRIIVNTSDIDLSSGSWSGRYFYEYPVTVTAVPNPGYRFRGWSDGKTESTVEITINGGVTANAIFEKE